MKSIKKFLTITCLTVFCTCTFFTLPAQAQVTVPQTPTALEITPRADAIEWRYKVVNGDVYRRQYNCTKDMWIGDWEYVG